MWDVGFAHEFTSNSFPASKLCTAFFEKIGMREIVENPPVKAAFRVKDGSGLFLRGIATDLGICQ